MRVINIVLLSCLLLTTGCVTLTSRETKATVKELVGRTQALVDAIGARASDSGLPPLKSAAITISQKIEKSAKGSVALVVSGGGGQSRSDSNSLTLVLVPRKEAMKAAVAGPDRDIADAVVSAIEALKDVDRLSLQSLTVDVGVEITKELNGGIKVELAGVDVGAEGKRETTSGSSLKLSFEKQ